MSILLFTRRVTGRPTRNRRGSKMAFWIDASAEIAHEATPHVSSRGSSRPSSRPSSSHSVSYVASQSPYRRPPPSPFIQALSGYSPPMSPYKKPRSPFLFTNSPSMRRVPGTQPRVRAVEDASSSPVRERRLANACANVPTHVDVIKRPLSAMKPKTPKHPPPIHLIHSSLHSRSPSPVAPPPTAGNSPLKSPQVQPPLHHSKTPKLTDTPNLVVSAHGIAVSVRKNNRRKSESNKKSQTGRIYRGESEREDSTARVRSPCSQPLASSKLSASANAVVTSTVAARYQQSDKSKRLLRAQTAAITDTASPRRSQTRR